MPVQKMKIGIVASINKINLPFNMGINKIEDNFVSETIKAAGTLVTD